MTVAISTAGYDKNSICWEVHDYAEKVRDGVIKDESFLPILYAADIEDDFTLEETWKKANPGYGTIIKKEYLQKESAKAKEITSYENTFRRLHLNQWTTNQTKWISDELWMRNDKGLIDLKSLKGEKCYAGLDLASIRDLTALVLVFPRPDEQFIILPYFFTPKDTAFIRSRRDKVDYPTWNKNGHMELTPGNVTDYGYIKNKIYEIAEDYDLKTIAYDRWNSSQLIIDIIDEGIPCESFGQGFVSMSQPCKEIERLVLEEKINHAGHPVLRWNMANLQMKMDAANNIKMDKAKSTEKIDGAVAMTMAIGAMMNADKDDTSTYDDNDMIFL